MSDNPAASNAFEMQHIGFTPSSSPTHDGNDDFDGAYVEMDSLCEPENSPQQHAEYVYEPTPENSPRHHGIDGSSIPQQSGFAYDCSQGYVPMTETSVRHPEQSCSQSICFVILPAVQFCHGGNQSGFMRPPGDWSQAGTTLGQSVATDQATPKVEQKPPGFNSTRAGYVQMNDSLLSGTPVPTTEADEEIAWVMCQHCCQPPKRLCTEEEAEMEVPLLGCRHFKLNKCEKANKNKDCKYCHSLNPRLPRPACLARIVNPNQDNPRLPRYAQTVKSNKDKPTKSTSATCVSRCSNISASSSSWQ
jgi:hypothetical protein